MIPLPAPILPITQLEKRGKTAKITKYLGMIVGMLASAFFSTSPVTSLCPQGLQYSTDEFQLVRCKFTSLKFGYTTSLYKHRRLISHNYISLQTRVGRYHSLPIFNDSYALPLLTYVYVVYAVRSCSINLQYS